MAISAFAPAKINLTLHVTGQRADGYHLLDSLVVFAGIGDRVVVSEGRGLSLRVAGPMAAGVPGDESNSILKAAHFLRQDNLAFTLHKSLPAAAGIGGGTADAAAALRAIAQLRGLNLPEDVAPLGADVPVCLFGRTARMQGIGNVVAPGPALPKGMGMVLANPRIPVATPAIFKRLKGRTNPPMPADLPEFREARAFGAWLRAQRNELEKPALEQEPVIAEVLQALAGETPLVARMSGSGATCFALFETESQAKAAGERLAGQRPEWWVKPVAMLNSGTPPVIVE